MLALLFSALGAAAPPVTLREDPPETYPVRGWALDGDVAVRASSEPGASINSTIGINFRVLIYELQDSMARTEAGWVDAGAISRTEVDIDMLRDAVRAARTPAERVVWAERAAALWVGEGGWDARALVWALEEAGDAERAVALRAGRAWPPELFLAPVQPPDGPMRLELAERGWGETGQLSPEELAAWRVPLGAPVWVLPDDGPTRRGAVVGAAWTTPNECGGTHALEVEVEAAVTGAPVAFWLGPVPPGSWYAEPDPIRDDPGATAAALALARESGMADPEVSGVVAGDHGWLRVADWRWEGDMGIVDVLDVGWVRGVESVISRAEDRTLDGQISKPVHLRDLDGDGVIEAVFADAGCSTSLRGFDGHWALMTASRCCGC